MNRSRLQEKNLDGLASVKAEDFYRHVLKTLNNNKIPYMVAGTYAVSIYTGIKRQTKDFDIFVKTGDYQKIIALFTEMGYKTEITDSRWLAKISEKKEFVDIIFADATGLRTVDQSWFDRSDKHKVLGLQVQILPLEELIWSKSFRMDRDKYEGPDVNHLILKQSKQIDWKHLLMRMDAHWEVLLSHLILFRFVYPSERERVPKWLLDELLERVHQQFSLPTPQEKVSRGSLLSRYHYDIDVKEWGYKDIS